MSCSSSDRHMPWHRSVDHWCEEQKELTYASSDSNMCGSWCGRRLPTVLLQICQPREMDVMHTTGVWLVLCTLLVLVLYVATAVCSVPHIGRWLDHMQEWLY